jgi:hypothetical protein
MKTFSTLDNQSWISIHGHFIQDWCHIPILLLLKHVLKGSNAHNLTRMIMNELFSFVNLIEVEVPNKLLCFSVNSVNVL